MVTSLLEQELEVDQAINPQDPPFGDVLPPESLFSLKVPQSSQKSPVAGHEIFKHELVRDILY